MAKLTPDIRDRMLKDIHDFIHHNGLATQVAKEIGKIRKDLQVDREERLKRETAAALKQVREVKNRKKFWLKLILGIAGLGAFWEFLPKLIEWIGNRI